MIILAKQIKDEGGYAVSVCGDVLNIGDRSIDLTEVTGYAKYFTNQSGEVVSVDGEWSAMMPYASAEMRAFYGIADHRNDSIASVWRSGEQSVVIFSAPVKPSEIVIQAPADRYNLDILGDYFLDARILWQKWLARREYLAFISPTESLAALEKQVDVLTEALVQLMPPGDVRTHLEAFRSASSYESAGVRSAIEFKQSLRNKISEYRRHKGGNQG